MMPLSESLRENIPRSTPVQSKIIIITDILFNIIESCEEYPFFLPYIASIVLTVRQRLKVNCLPGMIFNVKVKKVSPLQAMKAHGGYGCKVPHIDKHRTEEVGSLALHSIVFTPENDPGINFIGG